MRKHEEECRTSYELLKGRRTLWRGRGHEMVKALARLERKFGRGTIRIHVVFRASPCCRDPWAGSSWGGFVPPGASALEGLRRAPA